MNSWIFEFIHEYLIMNSWSVAIKQMQVQCLATLILPMLSSLTTNYLRVSTPPFILKILSIVHDVNLSSLEYMNLCMNYVFYSSMNKHKKFHVSNKPTTTCHSWGSSTLQRQKCWHISILSSNNNSHNTFSTFCRRILLLGLSHLLADINITNFIVNSSLKPFVHIVVHIVNVELWVFQTPA